MRDIAFCRQFTLDRNRLSRMVHTIAHDLESTDDTIASSMGVNPYMVTGFRGWFRKTGLGAGTSGSYSLSSLGTLISKHDPDFQRVGTLWLLHYYLASQHEEHAEVWYRCFNEFLQLGQEFRTDEIQSYVERTLDQTPKNKDAIAKDTKEFIKTYTQPAALGQLGLLVKRGKGAFTLAAPIEPEPLIVGYVLFDSWSRRFGPVDTVRLSQLVNESESIGKIFAANHEGVRQYIGALQRLGLVNFADTQHEPVTRQFHDDPLRLLERYYTMI